MDDRDYYGNKRLELAGQVCKVLLYGTVFAAAAAVCKAHLVIVQLSSFQWYTFSCGFTLGMSINSVFLFTASISAF